MNYVDDYIGALGGRSCGQDLEYTADFIELEQAVKGGDTVQYGEHVYAPEPIDWLRVESLCKGLYENTLDLRVVALLTRALLERHGLSGFIGGLRLVAWLLRERWEGVHPQLAADDQFDPLIRINTLAELAVPATVIVALKRQVLAKAGDGQALCMGDLDLICSTEGTVQKERLELLAKLIEPSCSADLMRSMGLMNALRDVLSEITVSLEEKTSVQGISPFHGLSSALHKWVRVVEDRLRFVATQWSAPNVQERVVTAPKPKSSERKSSSLCESREDVVRALDSICSYYQRHEPSSPVPFLIARVRRLTTMSFIDIIEELAPNAVTDLRRLGASARD